MIQFLLQVLIIILVLQMQRRPKYTKRLKSLKAQYDPSQGKLPFLAPHYTKEDMFDKKQTITRFEPILSQPHSEHDKTLPKNNNAVGFKLKEHYKRELMKRGSSVREGEFNCLDSLIHFSFLQRKKSKRSHTEKEQRELESEEIFSRGRQFYSPILFTAHYARKEEIPLRNVGQIRKQSLHRLQQISKAVESKLARRKSLLRRVRRIGNAVLFVCFLKRYSSKYRGRRLRYITKMMSSDIVRTKLMQLKLFFSSHFPPFYEAIASNDVHFLMSDKDAKEAQLQKLSSLRRLISILMGCICKGVEGLGTKPNLLEVIYSICKHGSFSCGWRVHSEEQLDILCISQKVGYIRADSYLEKSSILTLLFAKIIVFNMLLQPQTLPFPLGPSQDRGRAHLHTKVLSNIVYELIIDLQDRYLQQADEGMSIGNWRALPQFQFKACESMTVKAGSVQKNELISGLLGHSYIRQAYSISSMQAQTITLEQSVAKAHLLVKEYHCEVRRSCM